MKAYQYTGPVVQEVWPFAESLVAKGLSPGYGEKNADDLLQAIIDGLSQLFIWQDKDGVKAIMVTSFVQHPQYKVVFVEAVAGRGAIGFIKDYWPGICVWAAENGAIAIEAATQPGVTRLLKQLNARKVYDVVRYSLERPNVCS